MHDPHIEQIRVDIAVAWWRQHNRERVRKMMEEASREFANALAAISAVAKACSVTVDECAAVLSVLAMKGKDATDGADEV